MAKSKKRRVTRGRSETQAVHHDRTGYPFEALQDKRGWT